MKAGIKLVSGVAINDADYVTRPKVNGKRVCCPFYSKWKDMIDRAYSGRHKNYTGCTTCDDWLKFSNFKRWMESQDWEGKELDKDILIPGNKVYSPETCCFVDKSVNLFLTDHAAARGSWPIGVSWHNQRNKFSSQCCNPFSGKADRLGLHDSPEKAHLAWKKRKHELACMLADLQTDELVAEALRLRYAT